MTDTKKLIADLKHHSEAFKTGVAFTDVTAMSTAEAFDRAIEWIEKGYLNDAPTKNAIIAKIVNECIESGYMDEILMELLKASIDEKNITKSKCQWQGANLKAIGKIASGTGDVKTIQTLCEENEG